MPSRLVLLRVEIAAFHVPTRDTQALCVPGNRDMFATSWTPALVMVTRLCGSSRPCWDAGSADAEDPPREIAASLFWRRHLTGASRLSRYATRWSSDFPPREMAPLPTFRRLSHGATIRPSDDLRFSYQRRSGRVPSAISGVSGQTIREPILLARHMANLTRAKAFSQRLGEVVQQLQVCVAHAVVP